MTGGDQKGAARQRRPIACECAGTTLYPANPTPDKASHFAIGGVQRPFKGQLPAMLHALLAAGSEGVENRQCRLFSVNPGHQVCELRKRGMQIDMRRERGKPNRWVLACDVQEVRP